MHNAHTTNTKLLLTIKLNNIIENMMREYNDSMMMLMDSTVSPVKRTWLLALGNKTMFSLYVCSLVVHIVCRMVLRNHWRSVDLIVLLYKVNFCFEFKPCYMYSNVQVQIYVLVLSDGSFFRLISFQFLFIY